MRLKQTRQVRPPLPEGGVDDTAEFGSFHRALEKGVGLNSRAGCFTCQTRECQLRQDLHYIAASTGVARLVTIRLRTWANMISPEFETEFAKKVLGQPADLSRHGAADRQLAHEICFNIDDKM